MFKLVSLRLKTQPDATFHVHECWSQLGCRDCSIYRHGGNKEGEDNVGFAKYTVLREVSFSLIHYRVIYNYLFGVSSEGITL
jgi:hypothetical protein